MHRPRLALSVALALPALCALPATADAAADTRLAIGLDPALGSGSLQSLHVTADGRLRLDLAGGPSLAVGAASATPPAGFHLLPGGSGQRALGGGALDFDFGGLRLGGSLGGTSDGGRFQVSAGTEVTEDTSLRLDWGYAWAEEGTPGSGEPSAAPAGGSDLRITLRHSLAPNLYVAGSAAAVSEPRAGTERSSGMLFGASIGLKF